MKHLTPIMLAILIMVGCQDPKVIEKIVEVPIPTEEALKEMTIAERLQGNADATARYEEYVEQCGEDIACDKGKCPEGFPPTSKGCTYRITVDSEFLKPEFVKTGLLHDDEMYYSATFFQPSEAELAVVPAAWTLLDYGKVKDVPIFDQACGDCWAASTTKGMELIVAAQSSKVENFSVQYHVSSCQPNFGSCGGGYMTAADKILKNGQPFEVQDPYKGKNTSCKFTQAELDKGFEYRLESAPFVGSSLQHSRYFKQHPEEQDFANPTKIAAIKAAMVKYKSGAVVTVSAYSSSGGVVNTCGSLNSGGNHMVVVSGWGQDANKDPNVASVWNSWGPDHGDNGISKIKWDCSGKLNRGLGVSARVYQYKGCDKPADPFTGGDKTFQKLSSDHGVWIGRKPTNGQKCTISPTDGLTDFDESGCRAFASPMKTTEYHISAYSPECDETKSAMVLITPLVPGRNNNTIVTPHGEIEWSQK